MLRGHMQLIIPEIEQAAEKLPADDIPRYCALACVGEARARLNARPGLMPYDPVAHVRRLGRSLPALCDHSTTTRRSPAAGSRSGRVPTTTR